MDCINCHVRKSFYGGRGLCRFCYDQPSVRRLYPKLERPALAGETAADLDALIAQQMKCLPAWWNAEHKNMQAGGADL